LGTAAQERTEVGPASNIATARQVKVREFGMIGLVQRPPVSHFKQDAVFPKAIVYRDSPCYCVKKTEMRSTLTE
jgi:hypothetical protein